MENAAATWFLMEVVEKADVTNNDDLDNKIMKLLMGHKNNEDMPEAFNILTMIDRATKKLPKLRYQYDSMSEYAHPNWSGTSYLYAQHDKQKILTDFGKFEDRNDGALRSGLNCLNGVLMMFEYAYNKISDLMPAFIANCEANLTEECSQ